MNPKRRAADKANALQQERARIFLALHRAGTGTSPREFAEVLADVAALNGGHGPLDEDERALWQSLGTALQIWLATTGNERHALGLLHGV